jgi:transposase
MRTAAAICLSPEQRTTLERLARQRSLPARIVERARIVLLAAAGLENRQIAARMGITPEKVARWRKRFLEGGIAALEKDAPRPGRTRVITERQVKKVVDMTLHERPANATHWSTRTMAAAASISEASVRRIWHAHGLKPHLVRTFKLSRDPEFTEKMENIVGLYLNPPGARHGAVRRREKPSSGS